MSIATTRRIDVRPQVADSVWPTPVQLHLLRAALWPGSEARAAWAEWRRTADLAALDYSSWNLLPLAWRNLTAAGVQDEVLAECHGFYRFHWARNQLRLRQVRGWVAALQERGVPVVVLKGVALLADVYRDAGLRPMADADLLMSWDDACRTAVSLRAEGWHPQLNYLDWEQVNPDLQCSFGWQRGDEQLDVHWHVLHRNLDSAVTRELLQGTRPLQIDGLETRQLRPEDTLLHVCNHGVHYCAQAPFRWLADAAWILRRHEGAFDWERVLAMGRRTGTSLVMRAGLDFAERELRLPVPAEVLATLHAYRASRREQFDFRRTTSADEGGRWMRAWHLLRLLRQAGGRGPWLRRWDRMGRFLRDRWEMPSLLAAPRLLLKKALRGHRGTWATDRGKTRLS